MESENVREGMEWEARRVAAAFGVENCYEESRWYSCEISQMKSRFGWEMEESTTRITRIVVCQGTDEDDYCDEYCAVNWDDEVGWWLEPLPQFHEFIARGLYRLGIEDEDLLVHLNRPLNAHEQLELRLSMPREFWPQQWLDEENQ